MAIRLLSAVVVLPIVLVRFSPAEVVVWQLFASLFGLMLLLDVGMSATFSRMIAFARGGASLDQMRDMRGHTLGGASPSLETLYRLIATLRAIASRFAVLALLIFAVLGSVALQRPIGQTAEPALAWVAWAVVLAAAALNIWGIAFTSTLQGMNAIAPLRRLEVAIGLAQITSNFIALSFGGGLLQLVLVSQFWAFCGPLANRRLLREKYPATLEQKPHLDPIVLRVVWPVSWRAGLGHLLGGGVVQASGLIYSQMGTAREVAAYLVALRAATVISGFSLAPFYSKLPLLAELQASGKHSDQIALAQRGMRLAHWVFVLGGLTVGMFFDPLLRYIGSQTQFVEPGVWAVLVLAFFMERYGAMHLQLYSLTNHIVWHIANGATGLVMIALAVVCYSKLGQYSFPVAMFIAYAGVYCVYSVRLSCKAFDLSYLSFESLTFFPPAAALAVGLVVNATFRR